MTDWTPEQIAAGAEALAHWNGYDSLDAAGEWGAATYRTEAAAVLSAVDLSDHDRAVAADALRQAAAFWDSLTPEAADELFFDVADWLRTRAEAVTDEQGRG